MATGVGCSAKAGGAVVAGLAAAARGVGETAVVGAAVGAVGVAIGADAEPQASSSPTVSSSRLKTPIDRKNSWGGGGKIGDFHSGNSLLG